MMQYVSEENFKSNIKFWRCVIAAFKSIAIVTAFIHAESIYRSRDERYVADITAASNIVRKREWSRLVIYSSCF
ncbi:MAG: hypothetical protein KA802_17300 [Saprospiraceae bacterium]|nr:hypothetical protein [Saprospiraceae bacterium]